MISREDIFVPLVANESCRAFARSCRGGWKKKRRVWFLWDRDRRRKRSKAGGRSREGSEPRGRAERHKERQDKKRAPHTKEVLIEYSSSQLACLLIHLGRYTMPGGQGAQQPRYNGLTGPSATYSQPIA